MVKLTHSFYLKRISKSKDPFELANNVMKYWSFVQTRTAQSYKFKDMSLILR